MEKRFWESKERTLQEISIPSRVAAGDDEMFCRGLYWLSRQDYKKAYKCFSAVTDERLKGESRLCIAHYQLRNNDIDKFDKTIYSACLYDNLTRAELLYIVAQYEAYNLQFDNALKGYDEAVKLLYPEDGEDYALSGRPIWLR